MLRLEQQLWRMVAAETTSRCGSSRGARSLQGLAFSLLSVVLNKDIRVICSNWNARVLTSEQIEYAVNDARASLHIAEVLDHLLVGGRDRLSAWMKQFAAASSSTAAHFSPLTMTMIPPPSSSFDLASFLSESATRTSQAGPLRTETGGGAMPAAPRPTTVLFSEHTVSEVGRADPPFWHHVVAKDTLLEAPTLLNGGTSRATDSAKGSSSTLAGGQKRRRPQGDTAALNAAQQAAAAADIPSSARRDAMLAAGGAPPAAVLPGQGWFEGRKSAYYDNIKVFGPTGDLLFTVHRNKAFWYLDRNLAIVVGRREPPVNPLLPSQAPEGNNLGDDGLGVAPQSQLTTAPSRVDPVPTQQDRSNSSMKKLLKQGSPMPPTDRSRVDDVTAIRLFFQPNLDREDEQYRPPKEYFQSDKHDRCVVCGSFYCTAEDPGDRADPAAARATDEAAGMVRFFVVPIAYRKYLPPTYVKHNSYDVMLLCVKCMPRATQLYDREREVIARETGIPLNPRSGKLLHHAGVATSSASSTSSGTTDDVARLAQLRREVHVAVKAAGALIKEPSRQATTTTTTTSSCSNLKATVATPAAPVPAGCPASPPQPPTIAASRRAAVVVATMPMERHASLIRQYLQWHDMFLPTVRKIYEKQQQRTAADSSSSPARLSQLFLPGFEKLSDLAAKEGVSPAEVNDNEPPPTLRGASVVSLRSVGPDDYSTTQRQFIDALLIRFLGTEDLNGSLRYDNEAHLSEAEAHRNESDEIAYQENHRHHDVVNASVAAIHPWWKVVPFCLSLTPPTAPVADLTKAVLHATANAAARFVRGAQEASPPPCPLASPLLRSWAECLWDDCCVVAQLRVDDVLLPRGAPERPRDGPSLGRMPPAGESEDAVESFHDPQVDGCHFRAVVESLVRSGVKAANGEGNSAGDAAAPPAASSSSTSCDANGTPSSRQQTPPPRVTAATLTELTSAIMKGVVPVPPAVHDAVSRFIYRWRQLFFLGLQPEFLPPAWKPECGLSLP